jgi:hypothetical protein
MSDSVQFESICRAQDQRCMSVRIGKVTDAHTRQTHCCCCCCPVICCTRCVEVTAAQRCGAWLSQQQLVVPHTPAAL